MVFLVRLMSLSGPFRVVREERLSSLAEVKAAVESHAIAGGYSKVKLAEDWEECDGYRFTATTPGGRAGRNVAYADEVPEDE